MTKKLTKKSFLIVTSLVLSLLSFIGGAFGGNKSNTAYADTPISPITPITPCPGPSCCDISAGD